MSHGNKYVFLKYSFLLLSLFLVLLSACGTSAPKVKVKVKPKPTPTAIPDNGERFYLNTATSLTQYRILDGKQLWAWTNNSQSNSSSSTSSGSSDLTISNGIAYMNVAASGSYSVSAFNVETGKIVWKTPFSYVTSFVVNGDELDVGSGNTIYGVNASTGLAIWELPLNNNQNISLMLLQGSTLYVSNGNAIFEIDAHAHRQLWTYDMSQINVFDKINNMWIDGNRLLAATTQSFSAFDAATGKFIWLDPMNVTAYTTDTHTHAIQVVTSSLQDAQGNNKAGLLTIHTNSQGGTISWISQFPVTNVEQTSFTNDAVFIAQNSGNASQVIARSLKDGHITWTSDAAPPVNGVRTTTSSETVVVLRVSASAVYAVMNDGFVYAFDIASGKLLWYKGLLALDVVPAVVTPLIQPSASPTPGATSTPGSATPTPSASPSTPSASSTPGAASPTPSSVPQTQMDLFVFGGLPGSSTAGYVAQLNPLTGKTIWQVNASITVQFPIQIDSSTIYTPAVVGIVTSPLP